VFAHPISLLLETVGTKRNEETPSDWHAPKRGPFFQVVRVFVPVSISVCREVKNQNSQRASSSAYKRENKILYSLLCVSGGKGQPHHSFSTLASSSTELATLGAPVGRALWQKQEASKHPQVGARRGRGGWLAQQGGGEQQQYQINIKRTFHPFPSSLSSDLRFLELLLLLSSYCY
jgi:hypothetical protein